MKSWNAQYNWIWVKVRNEILQFISVAQQGISHCFHPQRLWTIGSTQCFARFHFWLSFKRKLNKLFNETNYNKENVIREIWLIKLEFPNFFWGVYVLQRLRYTLSCLHCKYNMCCKDIKTGVLLNFNFNFNLLFISLK